MNNEISIPYGAIKSGSRLGQHRSPRLFQFHMVRLKVLTTVNSCSTVRAFQFHMVRLKGSGVPRTVLTVAISIPYGAIKRYHDDEVHGLLREFQFHMVRLKDHCRWKASDQTEISIPYGAIKSNLVLLLVLCHPHFNSIWCD